jgi:hypothetical protein
MIQKNGSPIRDLEFVAIVAAVSRLGQGEHIFRFDPLLDVWTYERRELDAVFTNDVAEETLRRIVTYLDETPARSTVEKFVLRELIGKR